MENFEIQSTRSTPAIKFMKVGILIIAGKSMSEDSVRFYEPIIDTLKEFVKTNDSIEITVEMDYVNTSSLKMLLTLLKVPVDAGLKTSIIWGYEENDEDHLKLGEYFEEILDMKFHFKMLEEDKRPLFAA